MSIEYYNQNAEKFFSSTVNIDMELLYKDFLELIPPGGVILDAGCGSGRDTKVFAERGYTVTAFDASEKMVKLAQEHTNQDILLFKFVDIDFIEQFNGIWCCASLLHVAKAEIDYIFSKFYHALRADGIWYLSFKYGEEERAKDGRKFNDYTENSIKQELEKLPNIEITKTWITEDQRPDRSEKWVNVLVKKVI